MNKTASRKVADVRSTIKMLLDNAGAEFFGWREDYSVRGMFGKTSLLAFDTDLDPRSELAKKLMTKYELTYDNMGRDWIYYKR